MVESSNYEGGNFYSSSNYNYDLKILDKSLQINIHFPYKEKGSYSIALSEQRYNLILQTLNQIEDKKYLYFDEQNSINFNKSQILIRINEQFKLGVITNKDLSPFYDLIKFTIKESFEKNSRKRIKYFNSKTGSYFFDVRNPPRQ